MAFYFFCVRKKETDICLEQNRWQKNNHCYLRYVCVCVGVYSTCHEVRVYNWECVFVTVVRVLVAWLPAVLSRCERLKQKHEVGGWFALTFLTNQHTHTHRAMHVYTCGCIYVCVTGFVY